MTRFLLLETLTKIAYILLFSSVFSREIFPFSAYLLLHVHTGLNFLTGMYEHAKVQLLLIKFNNRTPGKNIPVLELQRCRFRNLRSSRYDSN